jgi:hypothetical protein
VGAVLLRFGNPDAARQLVQSEDVDLDQDDWFSLLKLVHRRRGGGRPRHARAGCCGVRPCPSVRGRLAVAGSGGPLGPVDAFLALAAVAAGERETARRHADEAERLCRAWQVPRVEQWLLDARDRYGI